MEGFRHSIWHYIRRNTLDSYCLTLVFVVGIVCFILLVVYYGFPFLRIPVSWEEKRINEVNNLIITLCSGYLVTYLFYFFTIAIPTAVKTQYKRTVLSERVRYFKDGIYEFLNGLCEFCYKQDRILEINIELFLERNCYKQSYYSLKKDSRHAISSFYETFKRRHLEMEIDLESFYAKERILLMAMENLEMWKMMEQLMDNALFTKDKYRKFLEQIANYYKLADMLFMQISEDKYYFPQDEIEIPSQIRNKRICSIVSIININNN